MVALADRTADMTPLTVQRQPPSAANAFRFNKLRRTLVLEQRINRTPWQAVSATRDLILAMARIGSLARYELGRRQPTGPAASLKRAEHSAFYVGRGTDTRSQPSNVFPLFRFHFCVADGLLLNLDGPTPRGRTPQVGCGIFLAKRLLIRPRLRAAKGPSVVSLAPSVWTFGVHGVLPHQGIIAGGC